MWNDVITRQALSIIWSAMLIDRRLILTDTKGNKSIM